MNRQVELHVEGSKPKEKLKPIHIEIEIFKINITIGIKRSSDQGAVCNLSLAYCPIWLYLNIPVPLFSLGFFALSPLFIYDFQPIQQRRGEPAYIEKYNDCRQSPRLPGRNLYHDSCVGDQKTTKGHWKDR